MKETVLARFHRLLSGAALVGASALAASCSAMTPIQTAELYNAGDGVRVEVSDDELLRVENLMVLAAEEGGEGEVYGALINDSSEQVVMSVSIGDGGIQVPVGPGESILLGVDETVVIPSTPAAPGAVTEAQVEAIGYGTVTATVPVLDDALPQYTDHVP